MRKILILFSDTGGGHRAAAEALCEALNHTYSQCITTVLRDAIVEAAVWPFNLVPKTYLPITKYASGAWGRGFDLSNSRLGQRLLSTLAYAIGARGLTRTLMQADPDLVVTVHPLLTYAPWRVWKRIKPGNPFVTVVTDLFDAHTLWFSAPADLLVVPTQGALQRGMRWGFPPERMRVVGLPVNRKFAQAAQSQSLSDHRTLPDLRGSLGLEEIFTVLVVGGGEGMGRIEEIARALSDSKLPLQLAIITGRNVALRKRLEAVAWQVPVRVTGFVKNMPDWMRASDVVVSKAGPGTIMEALAVGRPLLISGYLPGQEKGNVDFVEESGVGVFRDSPREIVREIREWMSPGNDSLERMRARARMEAKHDASDKIAELLEALVERGSPA